MLEIVNSLLLSKHYIPHGHCYLWQSSLIWLHLVSDLLIGLAYYSIPVLLIYFIRKREDVPFRGLFLLFSAFIISCGTTHLMAIWTLWYPSYWVDGVLKAITAFISCYTAIALFPILPRALALQSSTALKQMNQQLVEQIEERRLVEQTLQYQLEFDQLITSISNRFINLHWADIPTGINRALEEIGKFTQVDTSYIFRWDQEKKNFSMTYEWIVPGQNPQIEKAQNLPQAEFPSAVDVLLRGKVLYIPSVVDLKEISVAERKNLSAFNLQSLISIPLSFQGIFLGWVGLASFTQGKVWSESNTQLLIMFGEILTNALKRMETEKALQESERRYSTLAKISPVGMFQTDISGNCLYANEQWCQIAGMPVQESLGPGWSAAIHPEDRQYIFSEWNRAIQFKIPFLAEYRFQRPDGSITWVLGQAIAERDNSDKITSYVGTITDISERKKAEIILQHAAFHDSLTGLPNRALLMEHLQQAIKRQQRHSHWLIALLFLDLDRFKIINDSLGHLTGDKLLIALGKRLEKCKRVSDTLARLGGDEFVFLLEELKSPEEATHIAERIYRALIKPFNIDNQELFVSASIGITFNSCQDNNSPTQLLRDADTAMYKAKARGKSCYTVFDRSMYTQNLQQLRLESDLRQAIKREELVIYYQPIFSLDSNRLEGMEALVRWQHPEQGLISPTNFISIAEETGIIIALDQWVLKRACCQLVDWKNQFPSFAHLSLNVNLSGKHFLQSHLIEKIEEIIDETNILKQDLKLEITESILIENSKLIQNIFNRLKNKKIQVCLDDFGTGYSSLSYLDRFPLNTLKIDRSFISNLNGESSKSAIIRAIVIMARELDIEVIAEGVETIKQVDFLKTLGCFGAQGYWYSKPLKTEDVIPLLNKS